MKHGFLLTPVSRQEIYRRPAGRSTRLLRPAHPPPYAAQGLLEPGGEGAVTRVDYLHAVTGGKLTNDFRWDF